MVQFVIFCLGIVALSLLTLKDKNIGRYGFIVGLVGQPFWVYESIVNSQWGFFALSFIYAIIYAFGVYNHFYSKSNCS